MKLYKYLMVAAATLFLGSCTESAIDDLQGIYSAPKDLDCVSAQNISTEKDGNKRIHTVEFKTASDEVLHMLFVSDSYFLHSAAFTPAESGYKKGNYIVGPEGSKVISGGSSKQITRGQCIVTKDGDNYTLSGCLWLEDGSTVRPKGTVTLVYEAEPEPVHLTQALSYANNNANGTTSITLVLATDDVTAVPNAWGGVDYAGDGNYLSVDFYSADGSLAEGDYDPADSQALAPMTYAIGWDPGDLWGMGIEFTNWGTCWWTVENGVATGQHIETGVIKVAKKGGKYVISYDKDGLYFEFEGAIADLNGGGSPSQSYDTMLTKVISATDNNANGTKSISLVLASEGVEATYDAATWSMVYSGSGNYAAIDLYSEDGKIYAGTYTPAPSSAIAPMTYGQGWDPGDLWGMGIEFTNWGTCWWTVEDGATSAQHITEGNIEVEYADGIFTISYANGDVSFQYKGAIEGIEGVAGNSTPNTEVEYIEISQFLSAAVNNGTLLSLQLGSDGISCVPNAWGGADIAGEGNYLKIDLYTTDGTLAEGTYTPADNTAVAEGNFAMGYDPGDIWGMGIEFKNWGTAWMTREGDQETGVNITDGTIEVTKQGSGYVITLTSSAANVRYTGPINL